MKIQMLIAVALLLASSAIAQSTSSIDSMRMQAAKNIILVIGLGTLEATETQIQYTRIVAKQVLETRGAFLFDMPEGTARQSFEAQIGYQVGVLIGLCSETSVDDLDDLAAEGLNITDIQSLCL